MKVICGFPGIGKSYAVEEFGRELEDHGSTLSIVDSDSSNFSWSNGERNPDFPDNYIQQIVDYMNTENIALILISTHEVVIQALLKNNLPFKIVYPGQLPTA